MLKILYNSQVAIPIVLIDRSGFKTTQSSVGFPASRLQPILKNILAKLVETFMVTVRTGLTALVSTLRSSLTFGASRGKPPILSHGVLVLPFFDGLFL